MKKQNIKPNEELEKKEAQLNEAVNNWKRAVADYQNLEKRVGEERRDWIKLANKELILRLLPVLDTLMLAQKHIEDEGLKLSVKQFLAVLKSEGVLEIEVLGKSFDPKTMECVGIITGEEGKVLEEVRLGFIIGDKVLRVAQVKVGGKS